MNFEEFDLNDELIEAISHMGYAEATPIQEQAIPAIIKGKDIIACAQTGTGKTAAFVIPILNYLANNPSEEVKVLIVVPTRELAIQIDQQIEGFSYFLPVHSIAIYGGGDGQDRRGHGRGLDGCTEPGSTAGRSGDCPVGGLSVRIAESVYGRVESWSRGTKEDGRGE